MSFTIDDPRLPDRYWRKVSPEPNTGCWLWTGAGVRYGYWNDKGAHRVAYESLVGPIPSGLVIDHKCRQVRCVNPDHLEPVTQRENLYRGKTTLPVINGAKTHCVHGHEYTARNTYRRPNGYRYCRECHLKTVAAYKAARLRALYG